MHLFIKIVLVICISISWISVKSEDNIVSQAESAYQKGAYVKAAYKS